MISTIQNYLYAQGLFTIAATKPGIPYLYFKIVYHITIYLFTDPRSQPRKNFIQENMKRLKKLQIDNREKCKIEKVVFNREVYF